MAGNSNTAFNLGHLVHPAVAVVTNGVKCISLDSESKMKFDCFGRTIAFYE